MPGRLLIVDDDDLFRRTLGRALTQRGFDVGEAASADEAREFLGREPVDVVVLDYQLPDGNGLDLLPELRALNNGAVFIMATAFPDLDVAVSAIREGAFDFVAKGAELQDFLIKVDRAGQVAALKRHMADAVRSAGEGSTELIGQSPTMENLRRRIDLLSGADDTTVLLLGETGTGKGLVARTVHALSGRAYEPFVAVDCTTIPATLVESELFGHEKGSFTSATSTKIGRVEAAHKGTLFLDEIGELELPVQAKLLRLLEEREYTRVGSTRPRKLEARVIAATNRDLAKAVAEGRFRADLRYRLEVFRIDIPPLRERGDDIALLAGHFLEKHARNLGRPSPQLSESVLEAIRAYPFPGNVRQLGNMVEQAMLLCRGDELTLANFPVLQRDMRASRRPSRPAQGASGETGFEERSTGEWPSLGESREVGERTTMELPTVEHDRRTRAFAPLEERTPPARGEPVVGQRRHESTRAGAATSGSELPAPPTSSERPSARANRSPSVPPGDPIPATGIPATGVPPTLGAIREKANEREKTEILAQLEAAGGNVSAAARAMGITRSKLERRLRKYSLK